MDFCVLLLAIVLALYVFYRANSSYVKIHSEKDDKINCNDPKTMNKRAWMKITGSKKRFSSRMQNRMTPVFTVSTQI